MPISRQLAEAFLESLAGRFMGRGKHPTGLGWVMGLGVQGLGFGLLGSLWERGGGECQLQRAYAGVYRMLRRIA